MEEVQLDTFNSQGNNIEKLLRLKVFMQCIFHHVGSQLKSPLQDMVVTTNNDALSLTLLPQKSLLGAGITCGGDLQQIGETGMSLQI